MTFFYLNFTVGCCERVFRCINTQLGTASLPFYVRLPSQKENKSKDDWYTFRANTSTFSYFASLLNGDQHLKERICFSRSNVFTLRVDPILKGLHCAGECTSSQERCYPSFLKTAVKHGGVPKQLR